MLRISLVILTPMLASVLACAPEHDLDDHACPCSNGWTCNQAQQVCVRTMSMETAPSSDLSEENAGSSPTDPSGTTTPASGTTTAASGTTTPTFVTTTTPTCADGVQNQGETGIDCGGPCSPCGCFPATAFIGTFCEHCDPCGVGQGDCDGDEVHSGCADGLVCGEDNLPNFTGEYIYGGGGQLLDACVPPHCVNGVQDGDETDIDCGPSCGCEGDCAGKCGPVSAR